VRRVFLDSGLVRGDTERALLFDLDTVIQRRDGLPSDTAR
jgi:predicted 2-oxoglutarate/Fe(II)-dependent dioxygenase YbiX